MLLIIDLFIFTNSVWFSLQFSWVAQLCLTLCGHMNCSMPVCPSPTPGVYSNSHPSSRWCHPAISSSVFPFFSRLQSFPASGSFQMSRFFASGGQNVGVSASASVLPMNTQDWSPLGWTGWTAMSLVPLVSLIFFEISSLSHSIVFLYFFALFSWEGFLISPCYSL